MVGIDVHAFENTGDAAGRIPQERQQKMFRADIIVIHAARFFGGINEDLGEFLGERGIAVLLGGSGGREIAFDFASEVFELDSHAFHDFDGDAFSERGDTEQEMFRPDGVMIEVPGFLLGEQQDVAGSGGKGLEPFVEIVRFRHFELLSLYN